MPSCSTSAPVLAGAQEGDIVDRWIFSGNRNMVAEVEVAGARVVSEAGIARTTRWPRASEGDGGVAGGLIPRTVSRERDSFAQRSR